MKDKKGSQDQSRQEDRLDADCMSAEPTSVISPVIDNRNRLEMGKPKLTSEEVDLVRAREHEPIARGTTRPRRSHRRYDLCHFIVVTRHAGEWDVVIR